MQTRKKVDHGLNHALPFFFATCICAVVSSFSLVRLTPIVLLGTLVLHFPLFSFPALLLSRALSLIHFPWPGKKVLPEISFDLGDGNVKTDFRNKGRRPVHTNTSLTSFYTPSFLSFFISCPLGAIFLLSPILRVFLCVCALPYFLLCFHSCPWGLDERTT